MGELLLITDDLRRAEGLARDCAASTTCRIHDLYGDKPPAARPELIVSDVEALTSEAIVRLRRILGQVRGDGVPFLLLIHGNIARAEAQARLLDASGTLGVTADAQQILDTLGDMRVRMQPLPAAVRDGAAEVRQFFRQALFSGKPITPSVARIGSASNTAR